MKNFFRDLGEYFFGLETMELYDKERKFYKEKVDSLERRKELFEISKEDERICLFYGKILPNLIDAASLFYSAITKNFPYTLFVGEALRGFCIVGPLHYAHARINSRIKTIKAALGNRNEDKPKDLEKRL